MNETPRIIAVPPETGFASVRVAAISPDGCFAVVDGRPIGASEYTDTGLVVRLVALADITDAAIAAAIVAGGVERLSGGIVALPPQPPTVPTSVTRRQLLLVLHANGVTRAAVRAMLAGNEAALIEFDEASEFRRDHSLVGQLGTALGMSAQQIDSMFITAATL